MKIERSTGIRKVYADPKPFTKDAFLVSRRSIASRGRDLVLTFTGLRDPKTGKGTLPKYHVVLSPEELARLVELAIDDGEYGDRTDFAKTIGAFVKNAIIVARGERSDT